MEEDEEKRRASLPPMFIGMHFSCVLRAWSVSKGCYCLKSGESNNGVCGVALGKYRTLIRFSFMNHAHKRDRKKYETAIATTAAAATHTNVNIFYMIFI